LVFKVTLTYVLVGMPSIGIYGAAISTVVAFGVASCLNVWTLSRVDYYQFNVLKTAIKPVLSAGVMGICVWLAYMPLESFVGHKLGTLLAIALGGLVYLLMIFKTKTLTPEEFDLLPGGSKLKKLADKIG